MLNILRPLVSRRIQPFAKIASKIDSSLFENVQDYYENLIRVTPSDP